MTGGGDRNRKQKEKDRAQGRHCAVAGDGQSDTDRTVGEKRTDAGADCGEHRRFQKYAMRMEKEISTDRPGAEKEQGAGRRACRKRAV